MRTWFWGLCFSILATSASGATPQVSASRGSGHALALKSDGTVVAWGTDLYGQLGNGRTLVNPTPAKILGLPPMTQISAFQDHVLALDSTGRVWSWGNNTFTQLGERVERNSAKPGQVLGLTNVVAVEAGHHLSAALKSDGTVWVWGRYTQWDGTVIDSQDNPTPVQKLSGVVEISAGARHLLARKSDNTVWAMGQNQSGQLGLGDTDFRNSFVQVPGLVDISRISAADFTSAALASSGALYSWGRRDFTTAGIQRNSPGAIAGLPGGDQVVQFDARGYIALASRRIFALTVGFGVEEILPSFPLTSPMVSISVGMPPGQALALVTEDGQSRVLTTNTVGDGGTGSTVPASGWQWFQPTGMPALKRIEAARSTLFALAQGGDVYVWGLDSEGLFANGVLSVTSVSKPVTGLPSNIVSVEAGYFYSLALGADGKVWGWGSNGSGELGRGYGQPPTSTPLESNITGVSAIAACASQNSLYLKPDGTVWFVGMQVLNLASGSQIAGLPPIAKIGCAWQAYYAIDTLGRLWAWGENRDGLIGDGTFNDRLQPVHVNAFGGVAVTAITGTGYGLALTADGRVWMWGRNPALVGQAQPNPTPTPIAGIAGATAISAGSNHLMIRMSDGTIKTFGTTSAALAMLDESDQIAAQSPQTVPDIAGVESMAAGSLASFAIREDGTVFAWGENCTAAQGCQTLGDGTFAIRNRPVVALREGAAGNLDTANWFLDLKPGMPKSIPPSKVPKMVPVTTALSAGGLLNIDAAINYRQADNGRTVGIYVLALVPPAFFDQVKTHPGEKRHARARMKSAQTAVLVQLTPQGWATVTGQLIAFTTTVVSGNGSSQNILNNVRTAPIPGARFCIGYGSSGAQMLSEATMRDVIALPGAASTVSESPCVLAGVYVSGPAASIEGSNVDFSATVVGAANPSGAVQFRDGATLMGAPLALSPVNPAVASAQISTSTLTPGEHGIAAEYSGDANNPAARSEGLVHRVAPSASATSVALSGSASSRVGAEIAFTATITGRAPAGTVQFRDGGSNLGGPVPLAGGIAVLRIAFASPGTRSIDAVYSGDAQNQASTAAAIAHHVVAELVTEVVLSTTNDRPLFGQAVTLTAIVAGNDPGGTLTVRDESTGRTYGPAALGSGVAQVTVSDLAVGAHLLTATYSGDGNNVAASSPPIVVAVQPNPRRLANISTRMQVLTGNDVMIGGFVIGGSANKTVVVRARGPSLVPFGITNALANPQLQLVRSSDQAQIGFNDDWQSASNAADVTASGFAPDNSLESAILVSLAPGAYTAIVSGVGNTTGVGIVEVFEVDGPLIPLVNISTRGQVLTGNDAMIGGFIVQGMEPQTVVVRARGPSLIPFGITNALANPQLQLVRSSDQVTIATNDDWQSAANAADVTASGFAPSDSLESAILITLQPGAYTAIVTGVGGGTGVGIVEVFAN